MKTIALLCLLFCASAFAANPTFQSFNTNDFIANAAANSIEANTSPANPSALVTQAQLGSSTGSTNGQTLAQVIAIINTNAVVQNGGTGSNITLISLGVTNKFSLTNGHYLNIWSTDGGFFRSNTIPPFDWYRHLTNGQISYGTGALSQVSFNLTSGDATIRTINLLNAAPESGKTNFIIISAVTGRLLTNDLTEFIASVSNNAVAGLPSRTNFYNVTNAVAGNAVVVVGPDANGNFYLKGTNQPGTSTTNTMGGTAIDFINEEATTNLAGALVFSSVANVSLGVYNRKLIHVINTTGSDQTVTLAAGWGVGISDTFISTNNTRMNLWAEVQPGVFTNVFQKQVVTH